jgi:hypothetical protein
MGPDRAPDYLILATSLNYWRYAAIGAPGSSIRPLPMTWTWRRRRAADEFLVAGWWGDLGAHRAAVFIRGGESRVAIDRNEWPLDDSVVCQLQRRFRRSRLVLLHDGAAVAQCEYRTPRRPAQHWLDWPLDEQDYDFGSFITAMVQRRKKEPPLEAIWPFTRRLRFDPPASA